MPERLGHSLRRTNSNTRCITSLPILPADRCSVAIRIDARATDFFLFALVVESPRQGRRPFAGTLPAGRYLQSVVEG
jgi:hypothetical protein